MKSNKNLFCLLIVLLFFSALQSQKPYNVIFIGVDDMGISFDAFGNPDVKAPNFAKPMERGILFSTTYCQYPLCSPSRTSLFSGYRPDVTGVYTNGATMRSVLGDDFKFLPEYFHDFGYRTERYGKFTCKHENEISWDYEFKQPGGKTILEIMNRIGG